MAKDLELLKIIDLVSNAMDEAIDYNLTIEVIASSMRALRDNPMMDIKEALKQGLREWDL